MNPKKHILINLIIGALTAISNGAAAVMMLSDQANWTTQNVAEAVLFCAIGLSLVVLSALAYAGTLSVRTALMAQVSALAILLLALMTWGVSIIASSEQQQISWMVGILSALAGYLFFLSKQVLNPLRFQRLKLFLIVVLVAVVAVDLGVFAKVGWF